MFVRFVRLFTLSMLLSAGVVALACADETAPGDCAEALSTVEMNRCAAAEFEKADAELNATYQKALAAIPGFASDPPWGCQVMGDCAARVAARLGLVPRRRMRWPRRHVLDQWDRRDRRYPRLQN